MSQETEWFSGGGAGGGTQERPTILPLIAWALVIGLVLGAVFYSSMAAAQTYSAKDPRGNIVRITDEPCPEAPAWLNLRRAEMRYEGIDYIACWFALGATVLILDSNDEATPVPMQVFERDDPI